MDYQIENQIKRLREYTLTLQNQNKLKKEQRIILQKEIDSLVVVNKQLKNEFNELGNKIKIHIRTKAQIAKLQEQVKTKERQLELQIRQNKQMDEENINMKQKIQILKQTKQSNIQSQFSNNLQTQQQQIHRLNQQKVQLEQKLQSIKTKTASSNDDHEQIKHLDKSNTQQQDKQKQNNRYIADLYDSQVRIKDKIIEHLQSKIKQREKELSMSPDGQIRYNSLMEVKRMKIENAELQHKLELITREGKMLKKRVRRLEAQSVSQNLALAQNTQLTVNVQKQKMLLSDKIEVQSQENRQITNLRSNLGLLEQKFKKVKSKDNHTEPKIKLEGPLISQQKINQLKKQVQELRSKLNRSVEKQKQQTQSRILIQKENYDLHRELEKNKKLNAEILAQIQKKVSQFQLSEQINPIKGKFSYLEAKKISFKQQIKSLKNPRQPDIEKANLHLKDDLKSHNSNQFNIPSPKIKVSGISKSLKLDQKIQQKKPLTQIEQKIQKLKQKNRQLKLTMHA